MGSHVVEKQKALGGGAQGDRRTDVRCEYVYSGPGWGIIITPKTAELAEVERIRELQRAATGLQPALSAHG